MAGVVTAPWRAADGSTRERTAGGRLTNAVDVVAEPYSSASKAVARFMVIAVTACV